MTAHESSEQDSDNTQLSGLDELGELRSLLFGSELHERLENAELCAENVSRVLPEAIILQSLQQDEQLVQAIVPTVEEAIHASVKKDLNVLADALFPVIGPATRKAISTAIKTLTQSLNQTLEHSFSPQSFKWRLEAQQTGKSFAEIVLLRTLIYRVEQVLLIHKKTGLLLQHLVAENVAVQDGALVSAMLTAIQDFVQDSFSVQSGDSLETLQFGELTIWIEQGPQAVLAGIIRGNAPEELRVIFQETIERIHIHFITALNLFQGDNAPFEASRQYLEDCLQARYKLKKETSSPILGILTGSILFAVGFWAFVSIQEKQRWNTYLEKLNTQPGIVVITAEKRYGKYFLYGLRDPLAVEPTVLMKQANINPEKVISRWKPYLALDSDCILARARLLLQPPPTLSLKVDEHGVLYATGFAPLEWIDKAQKLAWGIPGITQFHVQNLIETELKKIEASKEQIEKQVIRFEEGNTQLEPGQDNTLQNLTRETQKITNAAPFLHKEMLIEIIGHASKSGSKEKNMLLSQARADAVLSALVSKGVKKMNLSAVGEEAKKTLSDELTVEDKSFNRSSSFKVILTDTPKKK